METEFVASRSIITASRITPFLGLMYTCFISSLRGKPDEETKLEMTALAREVLPVWGPHVPDLKTIIVSILKSKDLDDNYFKLGLILKQLAPQGKGDYQVPQEDIDLLKALSAWFRTQNDGAKAKLIKFASLTRNAFITQRLAPKVGNQQTTKSALEALVESLVGRKDTALTLEEAPKVRDLNPEGYRSYLDLRKQFNQAWKDALVSFIRKSGKDRVPYTEVLNYLKLNGIDHMMPLGFDGLIDDLGRFYTQDGQMIEGVPNAVTFPSVVMNKKYGTQEGGDWVFMARRTDGSPGPYFYTTEFKKGQATSKFSKVADLSTKIESMRKKWMAKVKNFKAEDPQCVAAVVLEILHEFAARVGSAGNAAHGKSTFGVSTLLVKHVLPSPEGDITLRYKGKDGVATKHKLMHSKPNMALCIKAIHQMMEGKDANDRLFTYKKGSKWVPINAAQVNQEFKACGAPEGVTVHKIRTVTGSRIFSELMNEALAKRKPKTEKDAMALFRKLAEAVGKKLNHIRTTAAGDTKVTGATALAAYVDTALQISFWNIVGFRIPKYLERHSEALGNE